MKAKRPRLKLADALELVIELASQNMLTDEHDMPNEQKRQEQALTLVERHWRYLKQSQDRRQRKDPS